MMNVAGKILVSKTVYATSFAATRVARKMWQRSVASSCRARANEVKHDRERERERETEKERERGNPISLKRVPAGPLTWLGSRRAR